MNASCTFVGHLARSRIVGGDLDNMLFMHVITWLLMQINALIITNPCMLSAFNHISIILCKFML